MKILGFLTIWLLLSSPPQMPVPDEDGVCLSEEEKKLYDIIMAYRKTKKLKPIPYSAKLSKVAQTHVRDLAENYAYEKDAACNPHSWSNKGKWSSCCYTSDHKKAKCMWDKPKEIAECPLVSLKKTAKASLRLYP